MFTITPNKGLIAVTAYVIATAWTWLYLKGQISSQVTETTTGLNNDYLTAEQIEAENQTLKDDIDIIKQQQTTVQLLHKVCKCK